MSGGNLSYDQLVELGWTLNESRGISTPRFTSVALCIHRDGHTVACVQGYGVTRQAALLDAASEANAWLRMQQLMNVRRVAKQPGRRRG